MMRVLLGYLGAPSQGAVGSIGALLVGQTPTAKAVHGVGGDGVAKLLEGVVSVPALLDVVEQFGQLTCDSIIWRKSDNITLFILQENCFISLWNLRKFNFPYFKELLKEMKMRMNHNGLLYSNSNKVSSHHNRHERVKFILSLQFYWKFTKKESTELNANILLCLLSILLREHQFLQ